MTNDNKTMNEKLDDAGIRTLVAAQAGAAIYIVEGGESDGQLWAMRLCAAMMMLDEAMRNRPDDAETQHALIGAASACLTMVSLNCEVALQG